MNTNAPATLKQLSALLRQGEGPALEMQQNWISPDTNHVIAMCKKHGAPLPLFEARQGFLIVMFRGQLVAGGAAGTPEDKVGTN